MTPQTSAPEDAPHLLIVDDDPHILQSLSTYFERHGHVVAQAATGAEGIRAYQRRTPDVVILDLMLPDTTGIEVLQTLRRYDATVVMLTGQGDIPTAVKAMQLGAENFLSKPPDVEHLTAIVDRAIEKAYLRRENARLLRYVPTTKKRIIRAVASVALLAAAAYVGMAIGGAEPKPTPVPSIAPTNQPVHSSGAPRTDSFPLAPGSPPPATAPAPTPQRR